MQQVALRALLSFHFDQMETKQVSIAALLLLKGKGKGGPGPQEARHHLPHLQLRLCQEPLEG